MGQFTPNECGGQGRGHGAGGMCWRVWLMKTELLVFGLICYKAAVIPGSIHRFFRSHHEPSFS